MTEKKIVLLTIFIVLFLGDAFSQDVTVNTFTGSGGKNTRPFTVKNGWEIQWDAKGDIFQLYLFTEDGELIGVPANQSGSGKGSSYQSTGGRFYLQVNALGSWSIRIIQVSSNNSKSENSTVDPSKSDSIITSFSGTGGLNTRPFKTSGPWEITWNAQGDIFQLYLFDANGNLLGVPANQAGAGKGSSYQAKAGTYYLQVNALGKWSIDIIPYNK